MKIRKRWIDESDVYILFLGGFYGLTLPDDEFKSYTQWEYEYAGEAGKPRFAFVVTDEALRHKPYDFTAIEYYQEFQEFKQSVMEQVPFYYVEDVRHIKMVLRDQLPVYAARDDLYGWVSGKDIPDLQQLLDRKAARIKGLATRTEVLRFAQARSIFGIRMYSEAVRTLLKFPLSAFREHPVYLEDGIILAFDTWEMAEGILGGSERPVGHRMESAFQLDSREALDELYRQLAAKGYTGYLAPQDTPWGEGYAIVKDPDGNLCQSSRKPIAARNAEGR